TAQPPSVAQGIRCGHLGLPSSTHPTMGPPPSLTHLEAHQGGPGRKRIESHLDKCARRNALGAYLRKWASLGGQHGPGLTQRQWGEQGLAARPVAQACIRRDNHPPPKRAWPSLSAASRCIVGVTWL